MEVKFVKKDVNYIISSIIKANNTLEKNRIFENSFRKSDNIKILLFDEENSNVDKTFKNREINGYKIFAPADYTKMWVLDSKHIGETSRELKIGKVIHFDINILSYLNKYLNNRKQNIDIKHLLEYLQFIKGNEFSCNISTALMERSKSPLNNKSKKIWSEIIISYVKFTKEEFSIYQPKELMLNESDYMWAKDIYEGLIELSAQQLDQYNALCCFVLKAFLIKQDKTIKNKLDTLLQYSLDVLNVYLELETVLIYYYSNADNVAKKIFEKIEGFSKATVNRILNTVWDISHFRLLETSLMIDNKESEEIFLSYIGSRDNAFNELANINPIKMFVIYEGQSFAIRKKGIQDVCTNEELLHKIRSEMEERRININKVDLKREKSYLINEIKHKQELFYQN